MAGFLHSPFAHTILGTGIGMVRSWDARACADEKGFGAKKLSTDKLNK